MANLLEAVQRHYGPEHSRYESARLILENPHLSGHSELDRDTYLAKVASLAKVNDHNVAVFFKRVNDLGAYFVHKTPEILGAVGTEGLMKIADACIEAARRYDVTAVRKLIDEGPETLKAPLIPDVLFDFLTFQVHLEAHERCGYY